MTLAELLQQLERRLPGQVLNGAFNDEALRQKAEGKSP